MTSSDPDVVATLGRIAGVEGSGEADLGDRQLQVRITEDDGSVVVGHARKFRVRDEGEGDTEVEVEGRVLRGKGHTEDYDDTDVEGHGRKFRV